MYASIIVGHVTAFDHIDPDLHTQTASALRLDEAQRLIGEFEAECRDALQRDEQCRAQLSELTRSATGTAAARVVVETETLALFPMHSC